MGGGVVPRGGGGGGGRGGLGVHQSVSRTMATRYVGSFSTYILFATLPLLQYIITRKKKIVDNNQCVVVVKFLKVQSSHHYALPWLHHVYSNIIKSYTERKETDTLTDRQTAGG